MKADVLALVQTLSDGQADAVLADRFYREVVLDLAHWPYLIAASVLTSAVGATTYPLPTTAVDVVACFYDDEQLPLVGLRELEAAGSSSTANWRDQLGTPVIYTVEDETARTFRLYPRPAVASKPFTFLFGSILGGDYPSYSVAVLHTETRDDLPAWLELPAALLVLTREYTRESAHRDVTFAQGCQRAAAILFQGMQG